MLDKRCFALLDFFNAACESSGYKVFDTEEILLAMPKEFGMEKEGLKECVYSLCEKEYLSVKYYDDDKVCLSPLPKGRLVFEKKAEEELLNEKSVKRYFVCSFIGAAFGGTVSALIVSVIRLFGGI